jgi:hypothetical protein
MSASLFDSLARGLGGLLDPVVRVVEEPALLQRLLAELGVPPDADTNELLQALAAVAELRQSIDALGARELPSFESIAAVLDAAADAFEALRRLEQQGPLGALEGLGRELVDLLVMVFLERCCPAARPAAALLTLLEPAEERLGNEPVAQGGRLVRDTYRLDRWHLDRLPALLKDPLAVLRAEYGNALPTAADAHALADKLFPRLVRLLDALGISCRYGFDPDDAAFLGDAAPLVAHALIVYVDDPLYGEAAESGIVLALSAADEGDLGLVISPFGTIATRTSAGPWTIAVDLGAGVDVVAWGRHGVTLLASPGTVEAKGSASATLATGDALPAYVIGQPDGARIEVGGARLGLDVALSDGHASLAMSADVTTATVVIAAGDDDGFLAEILPAGGLQTKGDLGLAWSSDKGLTLRGSAALEATLPVGLSFGGVTLSALTLALRPQDADVAAEVSASVSASIGPFTAVLDRIGIAGLLSFPPTGNLGVANLDVGFKPPSGIGLSVEAQGVVTGGGLLFHDPAQKVYAGVMQLSLHETVTVTAFGLIATRMPDGGPGYSLLVFITAEDFRPIPLPLGFRLTGIGGLLAVNRTFAEDVLRAGLKNHTLDSVMFPEDPIRNAPQILSNLNKVFPPADGRYLIGPMAQLEWGTPTLLTAQIAVVLEFGARLRLLVLAQIAAILPEPKNDLIRLQLDAVGVVDFDQGTAAVDASLHDSRLLRKFVLTGDMALRLKWVAPPNFAMAVGGLHPAFNPPPNFPKLERIAINLAAGDNPRIRCEAYFALTGSSIQFGARAELYASAAGFSIQGEIGFDVLIQRDPFAFLAEFYAQVQLKRGSTNLFKVRVEGALAGPRPLHVKAKATFEILWWDVSIRVDRTLVSGEPPPLPAPVDVLPLLLATLDLAGSWIARLPAGQQQGVTLRGRPELAGEILLHPLGRLTVRQTVVPLGMDISRFGDAAPAGARRFTIGRVNPDGQTESPEVVRDFFAPAQFFEMSDDEKLSRPSFESLPAGVSLGAEGVAISASPHDWLEVPAIDFETIIVGQEPDGGEPPPPDLYRLTAVLLGRQARFGAAANSRLRHTGQAKYRTTSVAKHRVAKEGWSIVATDDLTVQAAPGVDGARPASYSEAEQALRQLRRERPDRARDLTILRWRSEVRGQ